MPWYIRKIKTGEEEAFVSFLSAWVTNVPVEERFRWLYEGNPHGKGEIWLAVDKKTEKIAACTAIFPKKIRINGSMVLGCVGGDTYVAPQWRRQGIAAALHRATAVEMMDVGIELHYGFPLADNFQAKLKAGARHPGHFTTAALYLSSQPLLKKMKLACVIPSSLQRVLDATMVRAMGLLPSSVYENGYHTEHMTSFDTTFEAVEEEITSSFAICCVRDLPYLKWRFFENPFNKYSILGLKDKGGALRGYVALEVVGNATVISDLFCLLEETTVGSLLRAAVKFAVSHGSQSIVTMVNPEEPLGKYLLRFGFRPSHVNQLPLIVLTALDCATVNDLKNWHITAGYLDV